MRLWLNFLFAASLAWSVGAVCAQAGQLDTVWIPADADVTLYEDSLGQLANGAGEHLWTGRTDSASAGLRRRALLHFDIAGNVPAGAFVSDAALTLNLSTSNPDSQHVGVHRLYSSWEEGPADPPGGEETGVPPDSGDATWIHSRFPTDLWSTPGGVFDEVAARKVWVKGVGPYTWGGMYVAADVKVWLDTPSVNFGWVLMRNDSAVSTTMGFDSREHPTTANRPMLMVIYATPTWTNIPALSDNTLYEDPLGLLSNGAGEAMFSGRTSDSSSSVRRALLYFDVTDSVEWGADVFDARLLLHVSGAPAANQAVSVHLVSEFWSEGTSDATGTEEQGAPAAGGGATWLKYNSLCSNCTWSAPGGDHDANAVATTLMADTTGVYQWRSDSLLAAVQAWVSFAADNHGLLVKGDESQAGSLIRYDTREQPDPALRPVLQVVWGGGCDIEVSGDVNVTGAVTSADIIYMINFVFKSGAAPLPFALAGDVNCSHVVNSADIIYMVMYVFKGGSRPCDICVFASLAARSQSALSETLRRTPSSR